MLLCGCSVVVIVVFALVIGLVVLAALRYRIVEVRNLGWKL